MTDEKLRELMGDVYRIGYIGKALSVLKEDGLYIVPQREIDLDIGEKSFIQIPDCLLDRIRKMLEDYYIEEFNKYTEKLKSTKL